jgi:hypothetical protein
MTRDGGAFLNARQHLSIYRSKVNVPSDSLLAGILFDEHGERLIPSHTQRQSKRFRYYVSDKLNNGLKEHAPHGLRIPALVLENHIIHQLCDWLESPSKIIQEINPSPEETESVIHQAKQIAATIENQGPERYKTFRQLVHRVVVGKKHIEILLNANSLTSHDNELITLVSNIEIKRCGLQMRLVVTDDNSSQIMKDQTLINYLSRAYQWLNLITSGKISSIQELAEAEKVHPTHVIRTINKAFLAPDITRAILNGNQPPHLTLKFLKKFAVLPNDWDAQRVLLNIQA